MAQPDGLITDAAVAGVSGGRTSDEKIPRAWVVLSQAGEKRGSAEIIKVLKEWTQRNLTKQKWLRGGIEIVVEVWNFICHEEGLEANSSERLDTKVAHREGTKEGATGWVRAEEGQGCYEQV